MNYRLKYIPNDNKQDYWLECLNITRIELANKNSIKVPIFSYPTNKIPKVVIKLWVPVKLTDQSPLPRACDKF